MTQLPFHRVVERARNRFLLELGLLRLADLARALAGREPGRVERIRNLLAQRLLGGEADERRAAAEALALLADPASRKQLEQARNDPDARVRRVVRRLINRP